VIPTTTPVVSNTALPTVIPTSTSTLVPLVPAPTIPSGLYISDLRIDPNPPLRGTDLIFYPIFINTTGVVQNFKWLVYIYRSDTPNKSYSETTPLLSAIPVGANELRSNGSWKLALGGPCENYFARVAWLDQNNKAINFTKTDGQIYEKPFTVCAPSDLPSPTPGPSKTPTPTATFAPGLFVIDLRTDPSPPTRGSDLIFYPSFVNTIGSTQNQRWIVYIYKPGEKNSFGETTITATALGVGINDYQSQGRWKLPLGGPCEDFVVRVGWFDNENKVRMFNTFDNQAFEKTIAVCPP
jgi:hypothetical protein